MQYIMLMVMSTSSHLEPAELQVSVDQCIRGSPAPSGRPAEGRGPAWTVEEEELNNILS